MMAHTLIPMPTLDCLHKHISPSRLQERFPCTHATSLLSRDGRIADCAVRHPGVERMFSSYLQKHGRSSFVRKRDVLPVLFIYFSPG